MFRSKNHAYCARREILDFTPSHGGDIQPLVGTVQLELLTCLTIVQNHVKTATGRKNQLTKLAMGVPPAGRSTGNIIQIINTLDIERDQLSPFHNTQITTFIVYNRNINNLRFVPIHEINIDKME